MLASKEDAAMVAEMLEEMFKQICYKKNLPYITGDKVTFIGSNIYENH